MLTLGAVLSQMLSEGVVQPFNHAVRLQPEGCSLSFQHTQQLTAFLENLQLKLPPLIGVQLSWHTKYNNTLSH